MEFISSICHRSATYRICLAKFDLFQMQKLITRSKLPTVSSSQFLSHCNFPMLYLKYLFLDSPVQFYVSVILCFRNQQERNPQKKLLHCFAILYSSRKNLKCEFRSTNTFQGYFISILCICPPKHKEFVAYHDLIQPYRFLKTLQDCPIYIMSLLHLKELLLSHLIGFY